MASYAGQWASREGLEIRCSSSLRLRVQVPSIPQAKAGETCQVRVAPTLSSLPDNPTATRAIYGTGSSGGAVKVAALHRSTKRHGPKNRRLVAGKGSTHEGDALQQSAHRSIEMKTTPPTAMPAILTRYNDPARVGPGGAATQGREKPGGNYGHSNGDVIAASYSDRLGFDSRGVHEVGLA